MAEYRLTRKALQDLDDIWYYTVDKWSEQQADSYYNMLTASCQKIATNPNLYGKRYDGIFDGLRGFKVGKHLLFYRILDDDVVEIIRILHEHMDLQNSINE